jgi:hypothetical protein
MERPVTVLLCDDIRTENTGKHILIGVYPSDISPVQIPAQINLAAFLIVGKPTLPAGKHNFTCILDAGDLAARVEGQIEISPLAAERGIDLGLPLPKVGVRIQKFGKLDVSFALDDEPLRLVYSIPITPPTIATYPADAKSSSGKAPA